MTWNDDDNFSDWEPEPMYPYDDRPATAPTDEPRDVCPSCFGTGLNLFAPDDGGSCPACINGRRFV